MNLLFILLCCAAIRAETDATISPLGTNSLNLTESNPATLLDRHNISIIAQRLGLKIRWLSGDKVQRVPAERPELPESDQKSEIYPPFLRKSKFVLHLRERHKWSIYGKGAHMILPTPSTESNNGADAAEILNHNRSTSSSTNEEGTAVHASSSQGCNNRLDVSSRLPADCHPRSKLDQLHQKIPSRH
jgi:hypothetical protein